MGRHPSYSHARAKKICELLESGEPLRDVAMAVGVRFPTIVMWAEKNYDGFGDKYARAREIGYQHMADEILALASSPLPYGEAAEMRIENERRRLEIDTKKWFLSKCLPKMFGDRSTLDVEVSNDMAMIMAAALGRVSGGDNQN